MGDSAKEYDVYVPLPYEAKKWLMPGTILFFLCSLIFLMLFMSYRERTAHYKLFVQRRDQAEKTNGKVTQHFTVPPGIDISANVYPA